MAAVANEKNHSLISSMLSEPKPKRGGGKDMANIEGMDEVLREEEEGVGGRPPPVARKRKSRKLTDLDFEEDEEEDESEEYKASE